MKRLYESLKKAENMLAQGESLSSALVAELKEEFSKIKTGEKWLLHLIKASKAIDESTRLTKLMTFIVPIERELGKKITDTDLVVSYEDKKNNLKEQKLKIVLDNIRSSFNTGALFRTCEALGVSEVILTGYTQGFESDQVVKTSMGAKPKVIRLRDLKEAKLYLEGYMLVALETSNESKSLYDLDLLENTAFVVGNERFGLSEVDLLICDQLAKLPMYGLKNSLNVNAALSACGYEWARRFGL